jgi:hypothetical protein
MESRGEIRGGRFVAAFLGEQFALPEALDLMRAVRRTGETATAAPEMLSGSVLTSGTDDRLLSSVHQPG